MKRNMKFFTIVISLLLLSSVILTGCMYAIAEDNGETKPYDLNGNNNPAGSGGSIVQPDAPQEQIALREKFDVYLHKDGNAVTVFSEEQYAELKAVRESGKRNPLTYDEILYLINDSISLYFTYDEIKLTNVVADGINNDQYLCGNDGIIYPYHGDFSEIDPAFRQNDFAYRQYERMLEEIYYIIYYRIYVHDAGFEEVTEAYGAGKGTIVYADGSEWENVSSLVPQRRMQLLSLNGSDTAGDENKDHLVSEWEKMVESRDWVSSYDFDIAFVSEPLDAPLLTVFNSARTPLYQIFITAPNNLETTMIYPTYELQLMEPTAYEMYVSGEIDGYDYGPYFSLHRGSGRFSMSLSSYQSFALTGKYNEEDNVLRLYPENVEAETEGYYRYVFIYEDGEWVYLRDDSVPPKGSFDIKDGLRFRFVKDELFFPYSEKPIQSIRDYAGEQNIPTDQAIEPFFEDDNCVYSFTSVKSQYVIVTFADGSEMPIKEALEKGYVKIRALDIYGIYYLTEKKN